MPRNTTCDSKEEGLSASQLKVVESLLAGATVTKAAATAEVDRTTIHRWLRNDFVFQARLNRGKQELWESIEHQLLRIAHTAAFTVRQAVEEGNVRAALEVLKGMGALSGSPPPSTSDNPAELEAMTQPFADVAKLLNNPCP